MSQQGSCRALLFLLLLMPQLIVDIVGNSALALLFASEVLTATVTVKKGLPPTRSTSSPGVGKERGAGGDNNSDASLLIT
jgi:hypothetical protein